MPFPFWGILPLSPFFSDIHTTSTCLKSLPVLYSPLHGIPSVHTFHTPHMILSSPLYTTPALTGIPHLECSFHSAPVLFVIGCVQDSSFTLFAAPFVVWPHVPSLLPLATSFLVSKEDTLCTCVPSLHTQNILLSPSPASLSSSPSHYTVSLYLTTLQIYFGEQFLFSPFLPYSCNFRPGAQTLCNSNILISFFLLILPLMK